MIIGNFTYQDANQYSNIDGGCGSWSNDQIMQICRSTVDRKAKDYSSQLMDCEDRLTASPCEARRLQSQIGTQGTRNDQIWDVLVNVSDIGAGLFGKNKDKPVPEEEYGYDYTIDGGHTDQGLTNTEMALIVAGIAVVSGIIIFAALKNKKGSSTKTKK